MRDAEPAISLPEMASETDVRELALALPETTELPCDGTPGFWVADCLFAQLREPDVLILWVGSLPEKDLLLAAEPAKLFTLPDYEGHPSVLVRLAAVNHGELDALLEDAWRVRAPRQLVSLFDRGGVPTPPRSHHS
jgi:hypothetical protein